MWSFALSLFLYTGGADIAPLLVLLIELAPALCTLYKIRDVVAPAVAVIKSH
jgi:hypothetical protein